MKNIFVALLLLATTPLFAQTEKQLCETFLKSVQDKNFALLKPLLGDNVSSLKTKWQQVVNNAHRDGFDVKAVKIKSVVAGQQLPGLPMKSIIAIYEYNGVAWDDLLLMITTSRELKLIEIPLSSNMFILNEDRRGKNIEDSKKAANA